MTTAIIVLIWSIIGMIVFHRWTQRNKTSNLDWLLILLAGPLVWIIAAVAIISIFIEIWEKNKKYEKF